MNHLFEDFTKPTYADWVNQLTKDLKGDSDALIKRNDEIEEFQFDSYQHSDSGNTAPDLAFRNTYVSQTFKVNNNWNNLSTIVVKDEISANKQALNALQIGATALRFVLTTDSVNWSELTKEIQLEFIETTVKIATIEQFLHISNELSVPQKSTVFFEFDPIENKEIKSDKLFQSLKQNQVPFFSANGFSVQQAGATTWQELAFSLGSAHEALVTLMENGFTVDEAATCIHFNMGVGSTYFYEIAKIRALRVLWSRIIEQYQPTHACTYNTRITGFVGFTNKSLKDPYTNLLRQTTEAMSLAFAGVETICVLPYDSASTKGASTLSTRMATNISLILQEESYLDKVIDPLHGSYAVEYLTNEIASKAWALFQEMEANGGIKNEATLESFTAKVIEKARLRTTRIQEKTDTLIGINIFPNPTIETNDWSNMDSYLGMPQLILEQSI